MIYAEILSRILKTNVTIVDEKLRRIAVQNSLKSYYKASLEKKDIMPAGGIIAHTIQTGTVTIVDTPTEHEACRNCSEKEHCVEKYHISAPILVNEQVKGALSFVARNNQQKKRMEKNPQMYLEILIQFADLIALKIQETHEKRANLLNLELLQEIVEHSNEGVLVFDDKGSLIQMNTLGSNLLEIKEPLPVKVEFLPLIEDDASSVYLLKRNHQTYRLSGKRYHISLERYSDIFIFSNGVRASEYQDQKKDSKEGAKRLLGISLSMERIRKQVISLSHGKSPVLVHGNTGTEKKETALAIHEESNRKGHEAYSVNCKIYTSETLEAELMGIAPANSRRGKVGKLELLKQGTLILEEIDSLSLPLQAKILRILEDEVIVRKGGQKTIPVDVRIIATTAKDLSQLTNKGYFMEELYYKLITSSIVLPALADRKEDISVYARYHLEKYAWRYGKTILRIEDDFFSAIEQYPWAGNIWELKGVMEHVITVMGLDGIINFQTLPEYLIRQAKNNVRKTYNLKELEKTTIKNALREIGCDSKSRQTVADELGIGIATLYRKMKQYDLL